MLMMIVPLYGVESHSNVGCLVISVAIFLLFYDLKVKQNAKHKMRATRVLRTIANASIGTFLISQFFESCNEVLFNKLALTTFAQKLPYLAYLTPIKFLVSVVCGLVVSFIAVWIYKLILLLINKIKNKKLASKQEKAS